MVLIIQKFYSFVFCFPYCIHKSCWCKEIDHICAFGYRWWQQNVFSSLKELWFLDFDQFTLLTFSLTFFYLFCLTLYLLFFCVLIIIKAFLSNVSFGCFLWCWVSTSMSFDQKIFEKILKQVEYESARSLNGVFQTLIFSIQFLNHSTLWSE